MASIQPRKLPVRPYKDFLTPVLHRRFTNAALLGLIACWIEATLLSRPSLFWWWFPFGPTGIKALLLFLCVLSIFILRVAQSHIGRWNSSSTTQSILQRALGPGTIQTVFWYSASAFLFCEIYVLGTPHEANLSWVDSARAYDRPRLNERLVIFRSLYVCVALAQSALHIYRDEDRIPVPLDVPTVVTTTDKGTAQVDSKTVSSPLKILQKSANKIIQRALTLAICVVFVGPLVYFAILRRPAWNLAYYLGRIFFTLHKSARPTGLSDVFTLLARFMSSAWLLIVLWEFSNAAFTAFASQEPLRKDSPLTNGSKDPNGSLINGLRARKELPRTMAYWELALITSRFEVRRQTIYEDTIRPEGSTWEQVLSLCLKQVQKVSKSIQEAQKAFLPAVAPTAATGPQPMPRITQPLRQDNIMNPASRPSGALDGLATGVGAVAKAIGSSPGSVNAAGRAQKLLHSGADKVLSQSQQDQLSQQGLMKQRNQYLYQLLKSPIGVSFRQSFRQRVNAVIFGQPLSRAANIHHAVQALSKLTTCSLKEDRLGRVAQDVPIIIRTFVSTIQDIESFVATFPVHWTDVEFNGTREVKEVDDLLVVLRGGLEQILISFGEYADALKMSRSEWRIAKETVHRRPEMQVAARS